MPIGDGDRLLPFTTAGALFDTLATAKHPTTIEVQELPSLQRLESAFPGKSTGLGPLPADLFHRRAPALAKRFFNLLVKTMLWADEPVQYKGGKMTMLRKKGSASDVTNFRGIMLLAAASKHRANLAASMVNCLRCTGFAHLWQHCTRCQQELCSFHRLADAFHRLPRELAVGILHDHDVLDPLATAGNPMPGHTPRVAHRRHRVSPDHV